MVDEPATNAYLVFVFFLRLNAIILAGTIFAFLGHDSVFIKILNLDKTFILIFLSPKSGTVTIGLVYLCANVWFKVFLLSLVYYVLNIYNNMIKCFFF